MSGTTYRTAPDPKLTGWPGGIANIIGNEGCERFSYYGMKAILYIYVTGLYLNLAGMAGQEAKDGATQVVHLFIAAVYAFPMIGAIIADRFLGKYRTIMYLSIVYCLGHLALAVFENPWWQESLFGRVFVDPILGLYIGLTLIGIGSGGIKPCVSANVGDQFGQGNWHLLQKVFNAFYFIINFGSAFATLIIPAILGKQLVSADGWVSYRGSASIAFAVPGILMGLATIIFWMGRKKLVHVPPSHPGIRGLLDVLSGTSLFMVVGIPIFCREFVPAWEFFGSEVPEWATLTAGSFGSLGLFILFFSVRQKIEQDDGFLAVMFYCSRALFFGERPNSVNDVPIAKPDSALLTHWFFGPAARRFGVECAEGPIAVLKIMSIFIFVSVFWALFDQHSSTWIEQAKHMNRDIQFSLSAYLVAGAAVGLLVGWAMVLTLSSTNRLVWSALGVAGGLALGWVGWRFGPEELLESQIPAANPFLVMILIPYSNFGLYPLMRKLGIEPTPLRRMTMGMFIASLAFVAVALLQTMLNQGVTLHVAWQMIPYTIITLAEVMVSITGLEFAYSQAPKRMKSVIMGFWLFNVTLGNVLVAFLAGFKGLPLVNFFWVFAALMAAAAGLFGLRSVFYRYQDYTQ